MGKQTAGIHHITAIVGHPQENVDFYGSVLGLRLIKKTVNFDDPGTYHLYFGNEGGQPGTIITFFPWENAPKGKIGDGQVGVTSYLVPEGSLSFWEKRLSSFDIKVETLTRFGEDYLAFEDPHGLQLELVARAGGTENPYPFSGVTADVAIKGLAGTTLYSSAPAETAAALENVMGLERVAEEDGLVRYKATGKIGNIIDLKNVSVGQGEIGVGMVHHIAWRAENDLDHLEWSSWVKEKGFYPTEVKDRNYFKAVYYRERGGILFEIATDGPGFAHDESYETMGEKLMLPKQFEEYREQMEASLTPVELRTIKPE
ncbi:ring-cleaving dioxygenase [Desemzia sp. RIT804]|uniref:ring-cleaving dioxygenase n=1 Tax=Desemzia sp. RIT 804 TaxID=2810209 RepID=UPI001951F0F5|nr:ring-cleaving dioxygenase [Desemzia sp. RIT 804]MBM6613951.1 ring-cleaving dioxygenase [Desemzia sp. RIT 804]